MSTSPGQAPRSPLGHVPRLSYRHAPSENDDENDDESDAATKASSSHENASTSSGPSLANDAALVLASTGKKARPRSSRPSSAHPSVAAAGTATVPHPPAKKRGSLFSALFVKEPSSAALEHLAQKLISEHGELSARAIPGVSCATMPKTVPKVNSKWDGRPTSTRPKGKRGSDTRGTKSSSSSSSSGSSACSRSAEASEGDYASSRGNQTEPWAFDSSSSVDRGAATSQSSAPQTPLSIETSPSSTRGSLGANALMKSPRPYSANSRSLRSPSGSTLPPITFFFPDQIPDLPRLPPKFRTPENTNATRPIHAKHVALAEARPQIAIAPRPPTDTVLDNVSSPSGTSSDASPAMPWSTYTPLENVDPSSLEEDGPGLGSFGRPKSGEVVLLSSGKNVLDPPMGAKEKARSIVKAFPAGEASPLEIPDEGTQDAQIGYQQEGLAALSSPVLSQITRVHQDLEKRPDSSRARLGLRASMLVDASAAPVLVSAARVQQNLQKRSDSSRARLGLRASMPVAPDTLPWRAQEDVTDSTRASSTRVTTSPKLKPKGLGIFGKDKG